MTYMQEQLSIERSIALCKLRSDVQTWWEDVGSRLQLNKLGASLRILSYIVKLGGLETSVV